MFYSLSTSFHRAPQTMTSSAKILSYFTMATTHAHGPLRKLLVHLLACMLLVNLVVVYWCSKLQQSAFANLTPEILVINDRQVLLVSFLRCRADTPSLPVLCSA